MTSSFTLRKRSQNLVICTPKTRFLSDFNILWKLNPIFVLMYYWIYQTRSEKVIKHSTSLAFYHFSPTRLINSKNTSIRVRSPANCKFGISPENLIFANSVKRYICNVENSWPWHELPTSVNDRVISPWFYFHESSHMRSLAKTKPSRKFPNLL